jgi:tetratricopeptide (TPR) repeat protein
VCPLKNLLLLSKTLNEKERSAFRLAIRNGFPVVDLVNFPKKILNTKKEEITLEWDSMISEQKGSLEKDFVRTLEHALKSLRDEFHPLFDKLHSIVPQEDCSEYSLAPLFALFSYITTTRSKIVLIQPRIGIKFLRFEAIFELERENITNLIIALEEEFSSNILKVSIDEAGKARERKSRAFGRKYCRSRISITVETIHKPITLEDTTAMVKNLSYLVVEKALHRISTIEKALYKFPIDSYENFRNRNMPEFWLKKAGIAIEIPFFLLDEVEGMIRDNFGSDLEPLNPIEIYRKSTDRTEIIYNLYFSPSYDYVIDGQEKSLFLDVQDRDPYTDIGIEHLMRKEFDQALKFFRKAKSRIIGDLLNPKYTSKHEGSGMKSFDVIKEYFSPSDILPKELLSSRKYTDESDPAEIINMLKITDKWAQTAKRLRDIDILERQIRFQTLDKEEYVKVKAVLRENLSKTTFRPFKNFMNFLEDLGSFYMQILQETEREAPDSIKEWMRLEV